MAQAVSPTELLSPVELGRLAEICQQRGITWLAVFGSVARGVANTVSDVDLLVEFDSKAQISYLDLEDIASDLSPLFGGRYVDIGTPKQLHWIIRDKVLGEALVLYAG